MRCIALIICFYTSVCSAVEPDYYLESKIWIKANSEKMTELKKKMISDPVVDTIFSLGIMQSFKGKDENGFLDYVTPKNKEEYVSILATENAFYSSLDGEFSISIGGQKECYGRHCDVEIIYSDTGNSQKMCDIESMKKKQTVCSVKLIEDWYLRYLIYRATP
jgi:hypothetical protein